MITQFLLDGKAYNVQVMSLKRSFAVKDAIQPSETQSGSIYRNPIGTYYNYTLTIRQKNDDRAALDALWEAVSQPVASHVCVFPYNQSTITQRMYVTAGSQDIKRLYADGAEWRDITINFLAQSPKVTV